MSNRTHGLSGRSHGSWLDAAPCPLCGHNGWCTYNDVEVHCRRPSKCINLPGSAVHLVDRNGDEYVSCPLHALSGACPPTPVRARHQQPQPVKKAPPPAPIEVRHAIYKALLECATLTNRHREALLSRGLTDNQIERAGYGSLPDSRGGSRARLADRLLRKLRSIGYEDLRIVTRVPGIAPIGDNAIDIRGWSGILIPVRNALGQIQSMYVRADSEKAGKYTFLSSSKIGGPCAVSGAHVPISDKTTDCVRVTEGALKADVATALDQGMLTIGLHGLSWKSVIPVLQELKVQEVRVAMDADWQTNKDVKRAFQNFVVGLAAEKIKVSAEFWPIEVGKGIDDVLAKGAATAIEVLSAKDAFVRLGGVISEDLPEELILPEPPPDFEKRRAEHPKWDQNNIVRFFGFFWAHYERTMERANGKRYGLGRLAELLRKIGDCCQCSQESNCPCCGPCGSFARPCDETNYCANCAHRLYRAQLNGFEKMWKDEFYYLIKINVPRGDHAAVRAASEQLRKRIEAAGGTGLMGRLVEAVDHVIVIYPLRYRRIVESVADFYKKIVKIDDVLKCVTKKEAARAAADAVRQRFELFEWWVKNKDTIIELVAFPWLEHSGEHRTSCSVEIKKDLPWYTLENLRAETDEKWKLEHPGLKRGQCENKITGVDGKETFCANDKVEYSATHLLSGIFLGTRVGRAYTDKECVQGCLRENVYGLIVHELFPEPQFCVEGSP